MDIFLRHRAQSFVRSEFHEMHLLPPTADIHLYTADTIWRPDQTASSKSSCRRLIWVRFGTWWSQWSMMCSNDGDSPQPYGTRLGRRQKRPENELELGRGRVGKRWKRWKFTPRHIHQAMYVCYSCIRTSPCTQWMPSTIEMSIQRETHFEW